MTCLGDPEPVPPPSEDEMDRAHAQWESAVPTVLQTPHVRLWPRPVPYDLSGSEVSESEEM